jgi:uncharacterized membrane protein YedE/YeeE
VIPAFPNAQPLEGLIGGILIGLAAATMLLGAGRIAGVSGILARATRIGRGDMAHTSAWAFLAGLPIGTVIVALAGGAEVPRFTSVPALIVAGLLVGFGTRLGSGCTSGHGVCGVSRFSQRSMIATAVFIGTGVLTVFVSNLMGGVQ